jgi:aspartate-semialdehyde dehydrogenase
MPSERESLRIIIAGASSLLGTELKTLLEESRFAAADFRLLDEEIAAGTLTEAGGEATVIQPVEEGSFARARFVFFTGSPGFTLANIEAARSTGATIVDLSGALAGQSGATLWFPALDSLRPQRTLQPGAVYVIPSAAATAASALSLGLATLKLQRLVFLAFQPVSESGRAGIEELESQTSQLLSFQNVGKPLFDTQVAFTLLDRFGSGSSQKLATVRERVRAETKAALEGHALVPAVQLLHAPVFYGTAFAACAELDSSANAQTISKASHHAGFAVLHETETPSSISAAGESVIQLAAPDPDSSRAGTWWFWGAADNVRLPAANTVKLAEKLSS